MKFEDYHIDGTIKKGILELGWIRPTDIQFKAIQPVLNGEDVLAIAQTGTGKTASYVIPVLSLLHEQLKGKSSHFVKAIVLVPTRELAKQVEKVFVEVGKYTKVRISSLMGGVSQDDQIENLEKGVDVVIATPGRMFDLISQEKLDVKKVQMLVLDEADHMLSLGFVKDIYDLMRFIPKKHQTLFFSATIDKDIKKTAYDIVRNAIRIQISPKNPVNKNIQHSLIFVEMDDKRFFLENIIKQNEELKIIVFVRTRIRAERVAKAMERVNIKTLSIHGDVDQENRFSILKEFKEGTTSILISTDVLSRGIDIPDVDAVINYDLPDEPENYVHRVGRTGRGFKKGVAISFCSEEEKPYLEEIEAFIGDFIPIYSLSNYDYKTIINDAQEEENDWKTLIQQENQRLGKDNEW